MRSIGAIIPAVLLALPCLGQEKMSRDDTAAILFTNSFSFTPDGEPILSVGLTQQQEAIEFTSATGLVIQPSGPDGPEVRIEGNRKWKAVPRETKAAKTGFRVVFDSSPTRDFARVKKLSADWKELGHPATTLELGTLFSFEGTVFDTRKTLVCSATAFDTVAGAEKLVAEIALKRPGPYYVQEVLLERPSGTVLLTSSDGAVRISARNAVWFHPVSGALTVHDVEFGKGYSWHGRQTRRYGGAFYVSVDRAGRLAIANVLPAEKLLKGLVPAEIFPDSPAEALKAQATTARVEMLAKLGHRHLADPFHLCADQHCQVYKGLDAEKDAASKAVDATHGQVLFESTGTLLDARYHSTCGGHTEDASFAWPGIESTALKGRSENRGETADPYAPVSDSDVAKFLSDPPASYCGRSARAKNTFRWTKEIGTAEMDRFVAKHHSIGHVSAVAVVRRGVSGRAVEIAITGKSGVATVKGELTIRQLFGGLKSSLFTVSPVAGPDGAPLSFKFSGGGFGHGVGMCQVGAVEMAKDGKSFKEILQYYYRNVSVRRIY